ncbi:MAG: mechanosensitive ion channel [Candidatus Pacebacteria bacterium]|nr:mechanosensitive ion channel [Candidatus Paceibacterota bacterium]
MFTKEFLLQIIEQNMVDIIGIIILFFFGKAGLRFIVKKLEKTVDDGNDSHVSKKEQRMETLGGLIINTGNVIIYGVLFLMILSLFGIDITPILASAGVLGLAIGFGTQSLVKDIVSGLFILIENQYGIGDEIKLGSFEGKVLRMTIRSTVLKDKEGRTFYIPNGSIKDVINKSQ